MDIGYIIIVLAVILVSMTLHEFMHGYIAYILGDHTAKLEGRLTLNPIKHIDPFLTIIMPIGLALIGAPIFGGAKPVPINFFALRGREWGMAAVAAAGPLTNLCIAIVSFAVYVLSIKYQLGQPMIYFFGIMGFVNMGFFIFNMIPLPPLDGSRVLYAIAPEPVQRVMELIERQGILLVFVLVMILSSRIGAMISGISEWVLSLVKLAFGV